MEEPRDHRKAIVTFLAVVIIAIIVVAAVAASPKKKSGDMSAAQSVSSTTNGAGDTSASASVSNNANFKDGTYTATGSYESPGGTENITVHVTLKSGVIAATSADSGAQDPNASSYQEVFISRYNSLVVGKNITDVKLSRVSGSSLTSQGFNDAIQQIENKAKA